VHHGCVHVWKYSLTIHSLLTEELRHVVSLGLTLQYLRAHPQLSCRPAWWGDPENPELAITAEGRGATVTAKRYEIGCQLLLITRKSHTGFRLVPTSMTLNDLERRNSPYFAFFRRVRQIIRPIISQWLKLDL